MSEIILSKVCPHCKARFFKPADMQMKDWNRRRACRAGCHATSAAWPRSVRSLAERFWDKVDQSGGPDACWLWTGSGKEKGYGQMGRGRKTGTVRAHRVSWEIHHGPIPDGLRVLHRCDKPPCVNPAHLWLGTDRDNTDDMIRKGRRRSGMEARAEEIRALKAEIERLHAVLRAAGLE